MDWTPILMFLCGVFTGAWVYGRGRAGLSVLPRVPWPEKKTEPTEKPVKLPEVKP